MKNHSEAFRKLLGAKDAPNEHEKTLFERAQKYTHKLSKIPGIEMIAVVNSLSMYATHKDSDIDLFIITKPDNIWFARFFATMILWFHGVWRKGDDIAGNFCLSFFITTEALNLEPIAIENDIYLAHWIYYMKPVYDRGGVYDRFIQANQGLLLIDDNPLIGGSGVKHCLSDDDNLKIEEHSEKGRIGFTPETFGTFGHESTMNSFGTFGNKSMEENNKSMADNDIIKNILIYCNSFIRFFFLRYTLSTYKKLGKPEGVIISDTMLKFHDQDKRREIRDKILEKNFDK